MDVSYVILTSMQILWQRLLCPMKSVYIGLLKYGRTEAPLEQEDDDGFTALMWAARFGHPQAEFDVKKGYFVGVS